jgi:hypothetical protein
LMINRGERVDPEVPQTPHPSPRRIFVTR